MPWHVVRRNAKMCFDPYTGDLMRQKYTCFVYRCVWLLLLLLFSFGRKTITVKRLRRWYRWLHIWPNGFNWCRCTHTRTHRTQMNRWFPWLIDCMRLMLCFCLLFCLWMCAHPTSLSVFQPLFVTQIFFHFFFFQFQFTTPSVGLALERKKSRASECEFICVMYDDYWFCHIAFCQRLNWKIKTVCGWLVYLSEPNVAWKINFYANKTERVREWWFYMHHVSTVQHNNA